MKLVKSLLFWFVAIVVFFVALLAAVDNSEAVTLTFLDWSTPAMPISLWVLGGFLLGVGLTALLNTWMNTRLRLRARSANKAKEKVTEQLDQVKAQPVELTTAE